MEMYYSGPEKTTTSRPRQSGSLGMPARWRSFEALPKRASVRPKNRHLPGSFAHRVRASRTIFYPSPPKAAPYVALAWIGRLARAAASGHAQPVLGSTKRPVIRPEAL